MNAIEQLDARTAELVGIGSEVAANCLPCLRFHVTAAEQAGCSAEEIIAAIKVGLAVKSRPAADMDRLIQQLSDRLGDESGAYRNQTTMEGENNHADV